MKARVKATGEIIDVVVKTAIPIGSHEPELRWIDKKSGVSYSEDELFFSEYICDEPKYWDKLLHQYAGMAMQGMIRTVGHDRMYPPEKVAIYAVACATALVEKLKKSDI